MNESVRVKVREVAGDVEETGRTCNRTFKSSTVDGCITSVPSFLGLGLFVSCQIFAGGAPITHRVCTCCRGFSNPACRWNEWLSMGVSYGDLVQDSVLCITLWDALKRPSGAVGPLGFAELRLFDENNVMKWGTHVLSLSFECLEDERMQEVAQDGRMKSSGRYIKPNTNFALGELGPGGFRGGRWLDRLRVRSMEGLCKTWNEVGSGGLCVVVEVPSVGHPIMLQEVEIPLPDAPSFDLAVSGIISFWDPGVTVNPSEDAATKLSRYTSVTTLSVPSNERPNAEEKCALREIISRPSFLLRHLTAGDQELLWRFRHELSQDGRALAKVCYAVNWNDETHVAVMRDLMNVWAPTNAGDALELLSMDFPASEVRQHAVSIFAQLGDDELLVYMLQLVQSLGYDARGIPGSPSLAELLVERAVNSATSPGGNTALVHYLHWYLAVAWRHSVDAGVDCGDIRFYHTHEMLENALKNRGAGGLKVIEDLEVQETLIEALSFIVFELRNISSSQRGLSGFLHGAGLKSMDTHLGHLLAAKGLCGDNLIMGVHATLPLDPRVIVAGIDPNRCSIFKSALSPIKLAFKTLDRLGRPGPLKFVIFKVGDDLRQDQLVIQTIELMDRIMKEEHLDLKLTPYKVLATGSNSGMIEYVPSKPLSEILFEFKAIQKYFAALLDAQSNACEVTLVAGVRVGVAVLDSFVRSCAGYCVITYVLGVGDRHLDNLLLTRDGRLFHIDFSFIFGRDPKPLPPPMKLCKEMVEAMGGAESSHYAKFKSLCCEAFTILRKRAGLFTNLFVLMAGANINDIGFEPESAVLKLRDKLHLDLDSEGAVQRFQELINESVNALFPQITETIHRFAQYWR